MTEPERRYRRLMQWYVHRLDRCRLCAFCCAIYFVSNPVHEPRQAQVASREGQELIAPQR